MSTIPTQSPDASRTPCLLIVEPQSRAILDLERPSRVLVRTPTPILEPLMDYERNGLVSDVVFPTATDLRADGQLDVYDGAADRVVATVRVTLPSPLPATVAAPATAPDAFSSITEITS